MKVIAPDYDIWTTDNKMNPLEKIEKVARVCYKSEDKVKPGSAEKMVNALIKNQHFAMLEHASICIQVPKTVYFDMLNTIQAATELYHRLNQCYLRFSEHYGRFLVSGNIRAWRDVALAIWAIPGILESEPYDILFADILKIQPFLKVDNCTIVDPSDLIPEEQLIHRDMTVKFICDRGVSHEIVRHRPASFAQESTRYVNYGNSGEITVIDPGITNAYAREHWVHGMISAEAEYMGLLKQGVKPEIARGVLPTSVKTEIVMTANLQEWMHFFDLRSLGTTGRPHPQIQEIASKLLVESCELMPTVFEDYLQARKDFRQ